MHLVILFAASVMCASSAIILRGPSGCPAHSAIDDQEDPVEVILDSQNESEAPMSTSPMSLGTLAGGGLSLGDILSHLGDIVKLINSSTGLVTALKPDCSPTFYGPFALLHPLSMWPVDARLSADLGVRSPTAKCDTVVAPPACRRIEALNGRFLRLGQPADGRRLGEERLLDEEAFVDAETESENPISQFIRLVDHPNQVVAPSAGKLGEPRFFLLTEEEEAAAHGAFFELNDDALLDSDENDHVDNTQIEEKFGEMPPTMTQRRELALGDLHKLADVMDAMTDTLASALLVPTTSGPKVTADVGAHAAGTADSEMKTFVAPRSAISEHETTQSPPIEPISREQHGDALDSLLLKAGGLLDDEVGLEVLRELASPST